ncbi:Type V secretory pathway, partial [Paramagnetospirillum caucaseum]
MAENNNSNPPNDQNANDQHDGAEENAQQSLDDLTVLQNVQNQNMGDARLNVARSVDVSDTQLGNLANVQQGSTGNPQVQNLGGIAGGANISIDVAIESAKDNTVAPPELESLTDDVRDEAAAIVVNPGGAKPLNVKELPDLAKPDAEFQEQDAALGQPITLAPPGGFVANALLQEGVPEAPAAEEEAEEEAEPEIVAAVNQAPTVSPENLETTDDDTSVEGNVGAVDPDGDALTYSLVGAGADGRLDTGYGYVTIDASGRYTFTPDDRADAIAAGDERQLSFTVNVSDGTNVTTAQVGIDLNGSNDLATISGDLADVTGAVVEDGGLTASGKLSVSDDDTGEAHVQAFSETTDEGTFTINENGEWNFALNNGNADIQGLAEGETLTKTFTVTSADGTDTQEVTVTIAGTNDGPTVSAGDDIVIDEDSTFSGTAVGGDIDVGDRLTYALVDEDGNRVTSLDTDYGTVTIDAETGQYTFTPSEAAGELGVGESAPDSFKVVSIDNNGAVSAVDSVQVTITGSNDGPFVSDTVTLAGAVEDTSFTITREQLLSKAYDVDGGDLEISNLSASNGTITANDDGSYTFTPGENFNGNVDLSYTISDGQGGTTAGSASFDVAAVNDGPTTSEVSLASGTEDRSFTITAE